MAINILDLVKNYATNELVSKASFFLGENENGVTKAVSGLIPSLLGGIISKATSGEKGAAEIFEAAKSSNDSGILRNLGSLLGNAGILSKGTDLFNSLFGNNSSGIVNAISSFAGIKSASTGSIISMLLPLITGALGKHASENNLNASSFASLLGEQKNNIASALPAGLGSIGSLLGPGSLVGGTKEAVDNAKETAAAAYNYAEEKVEKAAGGNKWLVPLLLIAALGLLLWYFTKGCNNGTGTTTTTDSIAVAPATDSLSGVDAVMGSFDSVSGNFIYNVGDNQEISLADGSKLTVGKNSTEAKLFNFLSDANVSVDTADKTKGWITLDRVYFQTGKDDLTPESETQLKNIAAILANYPNAKIKLGGYTDNTGSADANKKVSGDRAKAAADKLVSFGVVAANVASEGYGPEHPVCEANDTPECRAKNRRVDVRVAAK